MLSVHWCYSLSMTVSQWLHPKRKKFLALSKTLIANSSSGWKRMLPPPSMLGYCLAWFCVNQSYFSETEQVKSLFSQSYFNRLYQKTKGYFGKDLKKTLFPTKWGMSRVLAIRAYLALHARGRCQINGCSLQTEIDGE